jgi:predicted amidohydrolase
VKVSLIQTATHWHDPEANHRHFHELLNQVPADTGLVVLPEMFSTGFTMSSREVAQPMEGATVNWLIDEAAARQKALCGSVVIEESGAFYNRFLWVTPDGVTACYDKRHRFRMAGEHDHYSAGENRLIVEYQGWRICPMVCYDLRFPVFFRNRGDYDVLVCVANWPAARAVHWETLLKARAIENQCYVVAVNIIGTDGNDVDYAGGSCVLDPQGEPLAIAGDADGVFSATLDQGQLADYRQRFPAWQDADAFSLTVT